MCIEELVKETSHYNHLVKKALAMILYLSHSPSSKINGGIEHGRENKISHGGNAFVHLLDKINSVL